METFQVFVVIPSKGLRKIYLRDVSEHGIAFEGEEQDHFKKDETFECHLYLNPGLKMPLELKITHIRKNEDSSEGNPDTNRIGCEFSNMKSKGYRAYATFLRLMDELAELI